MQQTIATTWLALMAVFVLETLFVPNHWWLHGLMGLGITVISVALFNKAGG